MDGTIHSRYFHKLDDTIHCRYIHNMDDAIHNIHNVNGLSTAGTSILWSINCSYIHTIHGTIHTVLFIVGKSIQWRILFIGYFHTMYGNIHCGYIHAMNETIHKNTTYPFETEVFFCIFFSNLFLYLLQIHSIFKRIYPKL